MPMHELLVLKYSPLDIILVTEPATYMESLAGKRKFLTLDQRVKVLEELEKGTSMRNVAKAFGCGKTQISRIKSEREDILREWRNGSPSDLKCVKKRKTVYEDINESLWDWFCLAKSENLPVNGRLIQEKALLLSAEMGHDDFTASNGWLECWRKRYNVKLSATASQQTVHEWRKLLPKITKDYPLHNIFNADETGLFYHTLPTHSVDGNPYTGINTAEDRITILLACSATGEKLKPVVVGMSESPRCFKSVRYSQLPVTYKWNQKAWMTSTIFSEWLDDLNNTMKLQGRKILLLVDKWAAHPEVTFSHVKLQFLPTHTTSDLKPCDAGVISTVKAIYRKRLLRHILASMDETTTATELAKSVTLLDAIRWLHLAWSAVTAATIKKCFLHCGFGQPFDEELQQAAVDEAILEDNAIYKNLIGPADWNNFVNMDNDTCTVSPDVDHEDFVFKTECEDVPECKEEEAAGPPIITARDALLCSRQILHFAICHGRTELIATAEQMVSQMEDIKIKQASVCQQTSIKDFFKPSKTDSRQVSTCQQSSIKDFFKPSRTAPTGF